MAAFLDALIGALRELIKVVGQVFSYLTYVLFVASSRLVWAASLLLILATFVLTLPVLYMRDTMLMLAQRANNHLVRFISDVGHQYSDEDIWLFDMSLPKFEAGGYDGFKYLFMTLALPFFVLLFIAMLLIPVFEIALFLPMLAITFLVHTRYDPIRAQRSLQEGLNRVDHCCRFHKVKRAYAEREEQSTDDPVGKYFDFRGAVIKAFFSTLLDLVEGRLALACF